MYDHPLILNALNRKWGHRYCDAFVSVLNAMKAECYGQGIPESRGDRIVLIQEFMQGQNRPLVVTLVHNIKDELMDEVDVEEMLLEIMEADMKGTWENKDVD